MNPFRTLGLAGQIACAVVALTALALVVWWAGGGARREAAEARAEAAMSDSRAKSAADAGVILDQAHTASTESETLSRETADAIRNAPGASVRLDPGLNRAARERLCLRAAYRDRPECAVFKSGSPQPSR